MTWRQATREEVYAYYTEAFPRYLEAVPAFITATGPKQYAIALRDPYPVYNDDVPDRDFIRRGTWQTTAVGDRTRPTFGSLEAVASFIQQPARNDPFGHRGVALADPAGVKDPPPRPEAVYYALDHWERPWVLLVDIDATAIARARAEELVPTAVDDQEEGPLLEAAGILAAAPEGYPYAFEDVERAIEYGFEVRDIFIEDFDAEETMVVYSGQGVHVYLLDSDPTHRYDEQSREVVNDLLRETYDVPIDPVVTADRRRLARLPYSLHAGVCRIVQPIESPAFDVRSATPAVIDE